MCWPCLSACESAPEVTPKPGSTHGTLVCAEHTISPSPQSAHTQPAADYMQCTTYIHATPHTATCLHAITTRTCNFTSTFCFCVRLASPCQMYTYSSDPMPPFFGPSAAIITALSAAHSHTAYLAATPSVSRCLFHSISCCSLQHRPSCLRAAAGRCKSPCAQRSPRRQLQRLLDCGTAVNSLQQLTTVPPDQHPTAIVPPDGEMPLTAKCH